MKRDLKLIAEAYNSIEKNSRLGRWLHTKTHTIHPDNTISIDGNVNLDNILDYTYEREDGFTHEEYYIPIRFKTVTGNLICTDIENLYTLKGSPTHVGGNFVCEDCPDLEYLYYAPAIVDGSVRLQALEIPSLEDCPQHVGRDFYLIGCPNLTSFEGAPVHVGGKFTCLECENLSSIQGLPPGCTSYELDGFTQQEIDQYFMKLELKGSNTGDPTFDDFFGLGDN